MQPAPTLGYSSWREWASRAPEVEHRHRDRWLLEQAMSALAPHERWHGHCALCDLGVEFSLPLRDAGVNFREDMTCPGCSLNGRVRAGLHVLLRDLPPDGEVYITEQASVPFAWLQARGIRVIGSEFTTDPERIKALGQALNGPLGGHGAIRFEDVTCLTMADASLDAVASFDVLEHVPDYKAALSEFARVLKPGGRLVLTAPFIASLEATTTRARIVEDGGIEHLLEPEYHGDPVSGGILCFYHFGWDLLDDARAAGFSEAEMVQLWAPGLGYCGALWTLVATR